jgi:hypothetical protein
MKKVGIITFHRAMNYGAVLQAYALEKKILGLGYECEIIDYRYNKVELYYGRLQPGKFKYIKGIRNILGTLKNDLFFFPKSKKNKFDEFIDKYLKLSKEMYNRDQLINTNLLYDVFITGSDQVWNCACTDFDKEYFLDFVADSHKKNSYGASFGFAELPINYIHKYNDLLKDFEHISVREKHGITIIKDLTGLDAHLCLDPTLLLMKDQWDEIAISPGKKKYILVYTIAESDSLVEFAKELAKKTGLDIIYIDIGLTYLNIENRIWDGGPREFLGWVSEAEYIITNSFHGTVFSINYHKKFFCELQKTRDAANSRLENMLDMVCLREREILDGKNSQMLAEIDYKRIDEIVNKEGEKSLKYLKAILEESYD